MPSPIKRGLAKHLKSEKVRVETVGDYFDALAGANWEATPFLEWPPDAFCLMASLLQRTGAYVRLVSEWPPSGFAGRSRSNYKHWVKEMSRRGKAWWQYSSSETRRKVLRQLQLPVGRRRIKLDSKVREAWKLIAASRELQISELAKCCTTDEHKDFWMAVFETVASADEACWGVGVSNISKFSPAKSDEPEWFMFFAGERLGETSETTDKSSASATLCTKIPSYLGTVLPKMHTPQSGLTLRSISHNLAYIRPTEVCITFNATFSRAGFFREAHDSLTPGHSLNVLLVPWPATVRPVDFSPVDCKRQSAADGFRFFSFNPSQPEIEKRSEVLARMLEEAAAVVGKVDGVLLPELALVEGEQEQIAKTVASKAPDAFLIAGVGSASAPEVFGTNKAIFVPGRAMAPIQQDKHHRWQLDGAQIDQYGLGSKLDPNDRWWEHIPIEKRRINVCAVSEKMTLSLLICEDLARQDPIADVIRCIGPNLVVALLMDGPQLSGRWPAHYATVLAEDPGSSVLTVTSIGMSNLCRPKGKTVSRVIGLWKDRIQGFREIELPPGAEAVVLTLTLVDREEWTADGRGDDGQSTYLTLNGIHPIFLDSTR
jgi:hypothetical protein